MVPQFVFVLHTLYRYTVETENLAEPLSLFWFNQRYGNYWPTIFGYLISYFHRHRQITNLWSFNILFVRFPDSLFYDALS
jgi:hypothetical protein